MQSACISVRETNVLYIVSLYCGNANGDILCNVVACKLTKIL